MAGLKTAATSFAALEPRPPVLFITSDMIQEAIAQASYHGGFYWIAKGEPLEPPSRLKEE